MHKESITTNPSVPEILTLTSTLPKEVKLFLVKKWAKELQLEEIITASKYDLNLEGFDEPFDLENAAFSKKQLLPLQKLWKDELPAEKLVEMLAP